MNALELDEDEEDDVCVHSLFEIDLFTEEFAWNAVQELCSCETLGRERRLPVSQHGQLHPFFEK